MLMAPRPVLSNTKTSTIFSKDATKSVTSKPRLEQRTKLWPISWYEELEGAHSFQLAGLPAIQPEYTAALKWSFRMRCTKVMKSAIIDGTLPICSFPTNCVPRASRMGMKLYKCTL
jgi:hypothetical protein